MKRHYQQPAIDEKLWLSKTLLKLERTVAGLEKKPGFE